MKWFAFFLSLSVMSAAMADCSTPAGVAGDMQFNTKRKVMQFCDGSHWQAMGQAFPAAANTGCNTPTGVAGDMFFNSTHNVVQFCNGENWINAGDGRWTTAAQTGCSSPTGVAGNMFYSTSENSMQFCNGESWINARFKEVVGPKSVLSRTVARVTAPDKFVASSWKSSAQDTNGNIYIPGYATNSNTGSLVRLNPKLELEQAVEITVAGASRVTIRSVVPHTDGFVYAAGEYLSGNYQLILLKFDGNLNLVTYTLYGGSGNDQVISSKMADNGFWYAAGQQNSDAADGNTDGWVLKIDPSNLNVVAQKKYGYTGQDAASGIEIDAENNVYALATTQTGGWVPTVVKFDENLNLITAQSVHVTGNPATMTFDGYGNLVIAGHISSNTTPRGHLVKLSGDLSTNLKEISVDGNYVRLTDQTVGRNGDIYAVGWQSYDTTNGYDLLLLQFDTNLNLLAARSIGGGTVERLNTSLLYDGYSNITLVSIDQVTLEASIVLTLPEDFSTLPTSGSLPAPLDYYTWRTVAINTAVRTDSVNNRSTIVVGDAAIGALSAAVTVTDVTGSRTSTQGYY